MDKVTIGSHETKLELLCIDRLDGGAAELIRARIVSAGLEAERDAYEYGGYGALATFFEDLADSWRGWQGEKAFASLEGDLDLAAVHDGHVRLRTRLQQLEPSDWEVAAELTIDPGEDLMAAALAVRALVGRPDSSRSPND